MAVEQLTERPYNAGTATPETLEALRFWVQQQLLQLSNALETNNAEIQEALNSMALAGYGGIAQPTQVALPNITGTFQTLPATVSASDYASRDVSYDLAADALSFDTEGVWRITVIASITFTDVNSGRTFDVELYNPDDGTVITTTTVFVGRNQDGFNISLSAIFPIETPNLNDDIVIRIGNASSTFTTVQLLNYRMDVNRVSEVKGVA